MSLPLYKINPTGTISNLLLEAEITDFHEAVAFIARLPYGRNSDRADFYLVIPEKKGTCSTKHACLAQLCIEHGVEDIVLCLGIYKMNNTNTPGIGEVLNNYDLQYIPEAHCYLMYEGSRFDFTREGINPLDDTDILIEETIEPKGIGDYKTQWHKDFLSRWIKENGISFSLEQLWLIREECIQALSRNPSID